MKKKIVAKILLILGTILFCMPIVYALFYAISFCSNASIIGGAGFPTFKFAFSLAYRGIWHLISLAGVICIIASVVIKIKNRKNKK